MFSPWCAGLTWVICGCKRPSSVYLGSLPFRLKMLIFWEITSIYLHLSPIKLNLNFNTWLDLTKKCSETVIKQHEDVSNIRQAAARRERLRGRERTDAKALPQDFQA